MAGVADGNEDDMDDVATMAVGDFIGVTTVGIDVWIIFISVSLIVILYFVVGVAADIVVDMIGGIVRLLLIFWCAQMWVQLVPGPQIMKKLTITSAKHK